MSTTATTHERVYQTLRQRVLKGDLQPGDRLPALRKVASEFEVNLNTVYQAIRRLEHDQLVVAQHGRGVFVADQQPARSRNLLLLNRIEGHVWAELTQRFIERLSTNPNHRLVIESVPDENSGQLPAFRQKLKTLMENGIDTVIFNGIDDGRAHHIYDDIPAEVDRLCIFSRRAVAGKSVGGVASDWHHGGYIAARHLIEVGCRNIVVITPTEKRQTTDILKGSQAAAADSIAGATIHSFMCHRFHEQAEANTSRLLEAFPGVDGIVTHGDFVAAPLIRSLTTRRIRVPEDIAVTGYYNTPWVDVAHPTITSVDTRCNEITDAAVEMYLAGDMQTQTIIHPRLVVRESTRRQASTSTP